MIKQDSRVWCPQKVWMTKKYYRSCKNLFETFSCGFSGIPNSMSVSRIVNNSRHRTILSNMELSRGLMNATAEFEVLNEDPI